MSGGSIPSFSTACIGFHIGAPVPFGRTQLMAGRLLSMVRAKSHAPIFLADNLKRTYTTYFLYPVVSYLRHMSGTLAPEGVDKLGPRAITRFPRGSLVQSRTSPLIRPTVHSSVNRRRIVRHDVLYRTRFVPCTCVNTGVGYPPHDYSAAKA